MKPILIAATALFVLSPMALAQEGHTTHNHDTPPAAATEADAADVMKAWKAARPIWREKWLMATRWIMLICQ